MRYAIFLLAAPVLLAASPAAAQASSQDWNNWVYRANSLLRAIASGEKRDVEIMCRSIHAEMAGKRFPDWATRLTTVCDALKEGTARGRTAKFCHNSFAVSAILISAPPVPEEPRAQPLAYQLGRAMRDLYDGLCK
jgi:hypothetical protein